MSLLSGLGGGGRDIGARRAPVMMEVQWFTVRTEDFRAGVAEHFRSVDRHRWGGGGPEEGQIASSGTTDILRIIIGRVAVVLLMPCDCLL